MRHILDGDVPHMEGRFVSFNLGEQYGFIRATSGELVFVHGTCLRAAGIKSIRTDDVITFAVMRRAQGLQAFDIVNVARLC